MGVKTYPFLVDELILENVFLYLQKNEISNTETLA